MVLTLIEYLQNSKQAIENLTLDNEITLVIGNEACDLDSAVSAIAYGYLLSIINSNNEILLPILNIKQEDYCLRTEINYVFNKADIPSYNLIFRDDLNLKELHYKGHVNIILVDHNSFKSHEKYLNSNIQEIIDHHEVLEKIDDRVNVTIEKVGSCATLVAEKFFGANLKQYDIKLALLLYATILTDTINLSPTAKKATNKDIKYLQALESQLPEMDRDDFFNSIQSAKFDVTGMTVKQILRKDIKTIESSSLCIAISSISIPIPELMRRNEAMSEIEKFCDTNNYQALVIMSLVTKEEIEREISIYSSFDSYREQIEDVLESTKNPSLELEVMEHRIPKMTAFHQKNASVSRKVVLPLLHKFLLGADSPLSPMNDTVMNQSFSKIDFNGISAISSTSSKNSNDTSPMSYFSTPSDRGKTPMTPKNSYADDNYIDNIQYARQIMSLTGNLVEKVLQKKNLMEDDDDIISSSSNAEDEQLSSDEKQEKTDDRIIDVTTQNNNETVNEHNSTKRLEEEEKQDSGKSVNGSIGYGEVESVEASAYTAQTVDFPDSPHQLKLLQKKSFDTQILRLDDEYDEEELRAALSPSSNNSEQCKDRPSSLDPLTQPMKRKILVTPDILRSKDDDQKSLSSLSNHSETEMFSRSVDDLMTPDDIDTPDDLDESILERFGSMDSETIPEMSAAEEYDEERSWRTCFIAGIERRIDMKVIEPYKKVLSHGGYYGENKNAIILFSACYLPDRSRRDYDYVMDNLFLYVLTTLDALVAEDYILIYLHGATQRSNMPSFGWLKRCYQMIDRRLRKNLKQLFLVHPSFWVKTIVIMTKPFISSKFSRKLKFITNLQELGEIIPLDNVCIPDKVKQLEFELMIQERKRQLSRSKSTPHQRNLGLG